ncbi:sodium:proton antiporter [Nocardioides szechwanensis]|uniref:Kef-type K+ transport system, membrane component KefB n=1 Tax=Nocardioides szechwanensis TaxID=1005944 RepID=A0A1H0ALI6_9ACTN|nr:cation:proton antiporter [Nocardioides szechwanensis]GEP34816.1 sodium:proton antiporter [Nocardioides szechwanensis]SDN34418.1 Kef-type K+ transport system, membrane component KefB [Nocardioides szechwanensis]
MHAADITTILLELALIIVLARAAGWVFVKIGLPAVVGEICAGIMLGPSLLGMEFSQQLFPTDTRPFLTLLAQIGLILFMFVVGLELDVSLIKGRGKVAVSVSLASILLPFSSGLVLASFLEDQNILGDFWPFALFVGAAMSVTAFPVLARILTDRNMHRTETGGLALACAATDDVLAWTLLAVVIGIAGGGGDHAQWVVALAIPFALFALLVIRPQLNRLTAAYHRAGRLTPGILSVVLVGLLLFAATTEYLGVHFIFGAFLLGAIMPHEGAAAMRHEILVRLEQLSVLLLLPVFFLVSGLNVNLRGLSGDNLVQLAAILGVAIGGKYIGAYAGARLSGVPHWQANSLGILMNTRGLTELVILNVGRELGLLGDTLFTMLVVMAVVTTIMTGPLLHFAYPARRVARDIAEAERIALGDQASTRVLLVATPDQDDTAALDVAIGLVRLELNPEVVVAALEPQLVGKLEMGSGLTDELAKMTASMERLEVLVRRGQEYGVPVRIINHPSADITADVVELAAALRPQFLVVSEGDSSATGLAGVTDCLMVAVVPGTSSPADRTWLRVTWTPDTDGDAAVVLACRLAACFGARVGIETERETRRYTTMLEQLGQRGLPLADGSEIGDPLSVGSLGRAEAIRVRAEVDAEPTDWSSVDLGVLDPQP